MVHHKQGAMLLEYSDYRSFLRSAIAALQKKNPAYSIRGFSKQVGLTQSALSQVIAGKRNLSNESATRIALRLGLNETEIEYFRTLVQMETTKDPDLKRSLVERAQTLNPRREVHELSVSFFSVIADWYHLAIKNMIGLDDFEFTPANVAKRLGITKLEVETAIERLLRLEVIEPDPTREGHYVRVKDHTMVRSMVPNEALRRFHRQMLEKAIQSLETQTPKEKIVGSETFAFSPDALTEANRLTEGYFKNMSTLSDRPGKRTEVYHLGVQFFSLTKGNKKS